MISLLHRRVHHRKKPNFYLINIRQLRIKSKNFIHQALIMDEHVGLLSCFYASLIIDCQNKKQKKPRMKKIALQEGGTRILLMRTKTKTKKKLS